MTLKKSEMFITEAEMCSYLHFKKRIAVVRTNWYNIVTNRKD